MPSKGSSVVGGLSLNPPSNSVYSLFPTLNFFAGLSIAIPWESHFFVLSLNVCCDLFGPGELQHHKPPMLGEAGLASGVCLFVSSHVGVAVPSVQGDVWPLLLRALFLVIPQK